MNERFHKAQAKLYEEMDLMRLIRMMRFARFLSAGSLKAHHWHMVHYFDKYCIKDSSDSSADSDVSKSSSDEQFQHFDANDVAWQGNGVVKIGDDLMTWFSIGKN